MSRFAVHAAAVFALANLIIMLVSPAEHCRPRRAACREAEVSISAVASDRRDGEGAGERKAGPGKGMRRARG